MSAGTVDLEYRCEECDREITEAGRGHAEGCETGDIELERVRYERMATTLDGICGIAEWALYGNSTNVRHAAERLARSRAGFRPGSWEAALDAEAQAQGFVIVGAEQFAELQEALDGDLAGVPSGRR